MTLEKVGIKNTNRNESIDGLRSTYATIPEGATLDIELQYKYKNVGGVGLKFKDGPYKFSINDKEFTSKVLEDKIEQFKFDKVETDKISIKAISPEIQIITAEVYTDGTPARTTTPGFTCVVVATGTVGRRWFCTMNDGTKSWYAGSEYKYNGVLARDAILDQTPSPPFPPAPPAPSPSPQPEPPSPAPSGELDEDGIKIIVAPKQGGLMVKDFSYKRSSHNTGTRDTFSKVIGGIMDLGWIGYFKTSLTKNSEEYSFKVHGGTHTGSGDSKTTRQGRCIALGLQQDGKPSFKIEYPHHSTTPDFSDKVTFADPNFKSTGSVKGKWIGLAGFVTVDKEAKKANYELWVDTDGLVNGKPANKWRKMYSVENTAGKFVKDVYLENQGIANGGQGIFYLRIDTVTDKTETYGFKVYEIEPKNP